MSVDNQRLRNACQELLGGTACGPVAGLGTGSSVTIGFELTPAADCARNGLTHSVFIENASWRLDNSSEVLCSSKSSNLDDDEMVVGLAKLRGEKLMSFELDVVTMDLVLFFSRGLRLCVFVDCMSDEDHGDNYSIFSCTDVFTVGPRGVVAWEERAPPPKPNADRTYPH